MKRPIAIWYHCLFYIDGVMDMLPAAPGIIADQMRQAANCGLLTIADEIHVGINGGDESKPLRYLFFPKRTVFHMHGLQCRNENRTILAMEQWLKSHPGWDVLYFHAKGATHPEGNSFTDIWRGCMMKHVIRGWRNCVSALDCGYDAAGVHWMEPPATPEGQYIFGGNFYWAKSDFMRILPSLMDRDRIKVSGVDSIDSRYESEVWLGNGQQKPKVMDFHAGWNPSKMDTCRELLKQN